MTETHNEKEKLLYEYRDCEELVDKYPFPCVCREYDRLVYDQGFYTDYSPERHTPYCRLCHGGIHKNRINYICRGASNILTEHLKSAFYVSCFLCLLTIVVGILIILSVYLSQNIVLVSRYNVKCKSIPSGSSLFHRALDSIEIPEKYSDPKKKVFYVIDQPLTRAQACNIESVLRVLPDKLVYLIKMDKPMHKNSSEINYITILQKFYSNLHPEQTKKSSFFRESQFEDCWNKTNDSLSTFAAKVFSVWQFGGAVLSENIRMNSRKIFDKPSDICMIDKDLIYCPHECSAYVYDLMKIILTKMKSNSSIASDDDFRKIIDDSVNNICRKTVTKSGCNQVYKLQESEICNVTSSNACQFFRVDKQTKINYNKTLRHVCPHISNIFK